MILMKRWGCNVGLVGLTPRNRHRAWRCFSRITRPINELHATRNIIYEELGPLMESAACPLNVATEPLMCDREKKKLGKHAR
jgi:hypothetical protein